MVGNSDEPRISKETTTEGWVVEEWTHGWSGERVPRVADDEDHAAVRTDWMSHPELLKAARLLRPS